MTFWTRLTLFKYLTLVENSITILNRIIYTQIESICIILNIRAVRFLSPEFVQCEALGNYFRALYFFIITFSDYSGHGNDCLQNFNVRSTDPVSAWKCTSGIWGRSIGRSSILHNESLRLFSLLHRGVEQIGEKKKIVYTGQHGRTRVQGIPIQVCQGLFARPFTEYRTYPT